jgi:hypothetical protein
MNATWQALVCAMLAGAAASNAIACGHCIEDRVAAVYDHAVLTRAMARKHAVVFFAIEGNVSAGGKSRRSLEAIVESVAGVDKGSARVSVESESLCVSFDPALVPFASMERALTRKFAGQGLSVSILRVMDGSAQLEEVRR